MDCFGRERKSKKLSEKQIRGLRGKVRLLEEEIKEMVFEREKEMRGYESYAVKEAEWKQEKKKLKEEVKRLRKLLEQKEDKNWSFSSCNSSLLVEERLWRDEAVQKWKKLYLAIKTELDDLIDRTHPGDGLYCKAEEEEIIEQLKMEVQSKDKTIQELKQKLSAAEHEVYKKAREADILRQSLRIMTSKKVPTFAFVKHPKKQL